MMALLIAIRNSYEAEPVRFSYVANVQSAVQASKTKKRGKTPEQIQQRLAEQEAISEVSRSLNRYYYG